MNSFFIALQFLTRLHIVKQTKWTMEDFGRSVIHFPLVGLIIGLCLCAFYWALSPFIPRQLLALLLMIFEFLLTGGLHADGFMDTSDGVFSGRERERKLEIMKDSRVGSNGVVAFVFLALLKWQFFYAIPDSSLAYALIVMPVLSRYGMTLSIKLFPYARPTGMGQAFAELSPSNTVKITSLTSLLPVLAFGWSYLLYLALTVAFVLWLDRFLVKDLGGLTGDTYGFVCESSELFFLFIFILLHTYL